MVHFVCCHRRCLVCASIVMLLLGNAAAVLPVGADTPLWVSCAAPVDLAAAVTCAGYAETILSATVQIRMVSRCSDRPEGKIWRFDSHATILDDHTLLTHNHFRILGDERCALKSIILYAMGGKVIETITDSTGLAEIQRQLDPQNGMCTDESCVLKLTRPSLTPPRDVWFSFPERAAFAVQIQNVPEVAVINWEGSPGTTYVLWTRPVGLSARGDTPVLELAERIVEGASGGGVYVVTERGVMHIGNGWRWRVDAPGSVAALNPAGLVE